MYQKRLPSASAQSFDSDSSGSEDGSGGGGRGGGHVTQDVESESESFKSSDSNDTIAQHKDKNGLKQDNLLNGLYNILILALCVLFSSPVLLLPQHNSIIHPDYWYEIMIVGCLSFGLTQTFDTMMACKFYFKVDSMISFRVFTYLYLIGASSWIFAYSMTYLVWTVLCGYNHPLPLSLAVVYVWFLVQYIALYVLFTRELSIRDEFRKKMRFGKEMSLKI